MWWAGASSGNGAPSADVVYIADAFQVMAKVNALLEARS